MAPNTKLVLVPDTMGRQGMDILKAREDIDLRPYDPAMPAAELHVLLAEAAGIALSFTPYRQAEMDASPRMQVVARIGVGFDAVEVPALTARGVPLMVAGTANSTSVAEQAVFFIMALAKRAATLDALVRHNRWGERMANLPGEIAGKTALVIGFGRIGTRSAKRCAALDMDVVVFDPYVPAETIAAAGYRVATDLDAVLPHADYVTIHCPKTPQTVGMFDAARIARMKPGAGLVNTARGGIVDENALYDALVAGHLRGAGLDVFDSEPVKPDNKLFQLEQVLLAPHMAGVTVESVAAMAVATARNMLSVFDGAPNAENVINKEVLS
ncbi:MAG: hydroxyacid dehydrogenase [Proteobacteria bacterium]|nr:hydroxyacid dehydrogenase [Pseudomonadota bacterium]